MNDMMEGDRNCFDEMRKLLLIRRGLQLWKNQTQLNSYNNSDSF